MASSSEAQLAAAAMKGALIDAGAPAEITLERIAELIRRHAPSYWRDRPIDDATRLDDAGIGLDSVGLVELLVTCERELALKLPGDLLLDDALTVGGLHARLSAGRA